MTYRPTPNGLHRDIAELLHVLAAALLRLGGRDAHDEETSAGTCYDDESRA